MWMLAVDTCSKTPSVALLQDDRLVTLLAPRTEEQIGVALFRWVEKALQEAGTTLADVEVYAVATGPGQFTGLRVGLTMVKGFAETFQRPVVEVGHLEALCEAAEAEGLLSPLVDARRGEVFAALYRKQDGELVEQRPVVVLPLKEFLSEMGAGGVTPESVTFVTPRNEDWQVDTDGTPFADSRREVVSPVLAEAVACCARRKFARGETVDALHLAPNYVRRPDAALPGKGK